MSNSRRIRLASAVCTLLLTPAASAFVIDGINPTDRHAPETTATAPATLAGAARRLALEPTYSLRLAPLGADLLDGEFPVDIGRAAIAGEKPTITEFPRTAPAASSAFPSPEFSRFTNAGVEPGSAQIIALRPQDPDPGATAQAGGLPTGVASAPTPGTLALFGLGLLALGTRGFSRARHGLAVFRTRYGEWRSTQHGGKAEPDVRFASKRGP